MVMRGEGPLVVFIASGGEPLNDLGWEGIYVSLDAAKASYPGNEWEEFVAFDGCWWNGRSGREGVVIDAYEVRGDVLAAIDKEGE